MAPPAQRPAAQSTAFRWFATWRDNGLFEAINHHLVMADRERVGREASPTAVVLDKPERENHREWRSVWV